jgi:hypothetical protein
MKKTILTIVLVVAALAASSQYLVVLKEKGITRSYRCNQAKADSLICNYMGDSTLTVSQANPFFEYRDSYHYIYVELKKQKTSWKSKFSTRQKSARGK